MTFIERLGLPARGREDELRGALQDRILVLDGSMGSQLQAAGLNASDFGDPQREGCYDALVLTRPDVVASVHERYLAAGADIIETNSFGATRHVLAEYGLGDKVLELNKTAARLAAEAARRHATSQKPRFVAGSMGPGTKTISLNGGITFAEVAAAHAEQAQGLMEGGADLLLLETQQDTLNVKASLDGIADCFQKLGQRVPVILSVSIEASGTMLSGQTPEALADALAHWGLLGLGLNCALGPERMTDHVRVLAQLAAGFTVCYPNAGLPDEEGRYGESPESFAQKLERFCREGWINVLGGCCGTTPEHIRAVAQMAAAHRPRRPAPARRWAISGLESLTVDDQRRPVLVGERANVVGSRLFKELIAREDFAAAADVGRRQARGGAQIIDVCLANPDRDELQDMECLLRRLTTAVRVPLMIDSMDPEVIAAALRRCPGKCIINSVNLEEGEGRFARVAPLARRYGAALVVGAIDEDKIQGMALTRQRKLAIAQRSHRLLTEKYGLPEEDLYFDCLVFPVGTGDGKYYGSAAETAAAVSLIKQALPNCRTVLGVSNVSFGLPPAGREVLNAVFLHRCVDAGLDLAIVNTEKLARYAEISEPERRLAEALLDWKGPGDPAVRAGCDPVAEFTAHFRQARPKNLLDDRRRLPAEERVKLAVVSAMREGLEDALGELLGRMEPLAIVNGPLMAGMAEVGRLFAANQLIVAEVLQCAEVMKVAVNFLEPRLAAGQAAARAVVALATVKGDVHDIGKNLVHIILKNNGYAVVDLGIKASSEQILDGLRRHKAQALGLSGLLVRSCQEMAVTAGDLAHAGVDIPIVAGGAALSARFVAQKIAPCYPGPVFHAKDALAGLDILNDFFQPDRRDARVTSNRAEQERLRGEGSSVPMASESAAITDRPAPIVHNSPIPVPPDLDLHTVSDLGHEDAFAAVDVQLLYARQLGLKGSVPRLFKEKDPKAEDLRQRVDAVRRHALSQGLLRLRAAYRFVACQADGDSLAIYRLPDGKDILARFPFPRQDSAQGLCLADFVAPKSSGRMDYVALFVVCAGAGVSEAAASAREAGEYFKSHALAALALSLAEAGAEVLHGRLRSLWGIGQRGQRFSIGYPACPDLRGQTQLLELLDSRRTAGVALTESFMMEPEASVSAFVFHHPQARLFSVARAGAAAGQ
ncbi:MAG TPA: methionine synthase [Elusimicrobia bacterium]|nr:methionine synthase [Elusimicrobiota bacterium]HBT61875.1 methionine synthase [Elusimicrobiota bacterium]